MLIITVQIFSLCYQMFPCVRTKFPMFPCLEKVRTNFPVFPVSWPPCLSTTPPDLLAANIGLKHPAKVEVTPVSDGFIKKRSRE